MISKSAEPGCCGQLVAETDAVVEDAERHAEAAALCGRLLDGHAQLVVVVAHSRDLAPRLRPRFVVQCCAPCRPCAAVAERGRAAKLEAEARLREHVPPAALHPVGQPPVVVGRDDDDVPSVGRSDRERVSRSVWRRRDLRGRRLARRRRRGAGDERTDEGEAYDGSAADDEDRMSCSLAVDDVWMCRAVGGGISGFQNL